MGTNIYLIKNEKTNFIITVCIGEETAKQYVRMYRRKHRQTKLAIEEVETIWTEKDIDFLKKF